MNVIALYNMKGGVGKTTAAVNLAYLAAASGQRTLLWDLDPQAASSFAFRVRPRVAGFDRKSLATGRALAAAIRETDYTGLDLLPADFAYRKLDRLLDHLGKPKRVVSTLLDALGRNYDVIFLDCPAGFSLLTEGIFAAADAILVPTIPTVLSLRTLARLLKWAGRSESPSELAAFFSMVDRRKALHRQACEWGAERRDVFLATEIPYASAVEQMTIKRLPLAMFTATEPATKAFAALWAEVVRRLQQRRTATPAAGDTRAQQQRAIEALVASLETGAQASRSSPVPAPSTIASADMLDASATRGAPGLAAAFAFVHTFDTDTRDLERSGYVLELRERDGAFLVVAATADSRSAVGPIARTEVRVDGWWATQILSGEMSPLAALERRQDSPFTWLLGHLRGVIGSSQIRRVQSRNSPDAESSAAPGVSIARVK